MQSHTGTFCLEITCRYSGWVIPDVKKKRVNSLLCVAGKSLHLKSSCDKSATR